jgi:hypothetical protein
LESEVEDEVYVQHAGSVQNARGTEELTADQRVGECDRYGAIRIIRSDEADTFGIVFNKAEVGCVAVANTRSVWSKQTGRQCLACPRA